MGKRPAEVGRTGPLPLIGNTPAGECSHCLGHDVDDPASHYALGLPLARHGACPPIGAASARLA